MKKQRLLLGVVALLLVGPAVSAWGQEDGFPLPDLEVITPENAGRIQELAVLSLLDIEGLEIEEGFFSCVTSIAFTSDGSTITLSTYKGYLILLDVGTGECLEATGANSWLLGGLHLALSSDGAILATVGDHVALWHMATIEPFALLTGHSMSVVSVAFSPDGTLVASGGGHNDPSILLWQVAVWDDLSGESMEVETPQGDYTLIEVETPLASMWGHSESVESLAFSPDGMTLASGGWERLGDGSVYLFPVIDDNGEVVKGRRPHDEMLYELEWYARVNSIAFSPDGKWLVCGNSDGLIWRWNARSPWQTINVLGRHDEEIRSVVFSPDGAMLATGSGGWNDNGTVRLWDFSTWEPLTEIESYPGEVYSVAFDPKGTLLVFGGTDGTIRLWGVPADR